MATAVDGSETAAISTRGAPFGRERAASGALRARSINGCSGLPMNGGAASATNATTSMGATTGALHGLRTSCGEGAAEQHRGQLLLRSARESGHDAYRPRCVDRGRNARHRRERRVDSVGRSVPRELPALVHRGNEIMRTQACIGVVHELLMRAPMGMSRSWYSRSRKISVRASSKRSGVHPVSSAGGSPGR